MAEESPSSSPSVVQPSTTASQDTPLTTDQTRNVNTPAHAPVFDELPSDANAAAPLPTNGANTCSTSFEQPAPISNEILTPIDPNTAGSNSSESDNVPLYYLPRKSFSTLSDESFALLCRLCMLGKNPNAKDQHTCFYSNFKGIKELGLTENQMKGAMRRLRQLNLILSDSQGRSRFITLNWDLIKKGTIAVQPTPPASMPADCASDRTYTTSFITSLPSGADAVTPNTDVKADSDTTTTNVATDKSLMQWELSGPLFYSIDLTENNFDSPLLATLSTPSEHKPLSHELFWLFSSSKMAGSKAIQVPLSSFSARSDINTTEVSLPLLVDCVELILTSSSVADVATPDSASAQSLSQENAVAEVNQPNREQTNVAAPLHNAGQMQAPAQEFSTSAAVPPTTYRPASSTGGYGYDL